MLFRWNKKPRYPKRSPLPIIRRRLPMRYHMKHQFGVHDVAFLQTMHALSGAPMSTGNRVEILKNGVQIFPSMLAAIRGAKKNINLEFYIYWDGEIGRLFAETLAERARAGVEVKVILDSVGSATMSHSLIDFMQRNGIDLEWYHPLRWYTLSRFNHRTHRKLLVVDGETAITGGHCIGNEWAGDPKARRQPWRDRPAATQALGLRRSFPRGALDRNGVRTTAGAARVLRGLRHRPQPP